MVASPAQKFPGWCRYSDIVVRARAFDAIDSGGGGGGRGKIDAPAGPAASQTARFCPLACEKNKRKVLGLRQDGRPRASQIHLINDSDLRLLGSS